MQDILDDTQAQYWARGMPDAFRDWRDVAQYKIPFERGSFIECNKADVIFHNSTGIEEKLSLPTQDLRGFFLLNHNLYRFEDGNFLSVSAAGSKPCLIIGDILHRSEYNGHSPDVHLFWNVLTSNVLLFYDHSFYRCAPLPDGLLVTEFIFEVKDINIDQVCSFYYDEQSGRLFLGSATKGLYVLSRKKFHTLNDQERHGEDLYYAQIAFRHNAVLTALHSVIGLDASGKTFVEHPSGINSDLYALGMSKTDSTIWTKQYNTLYHLDRQLQPLENWELPDRIDVLYEDDHKILWLGLRHKGIYKLDRNQTHPRPELVTAQKSATFFQEGAGGDLWIGSADGVYLLKKNTRELLQINGLKGKHIRSLYFRLPDQLWITTYEDGIFLYDGKKLTDFPEDKNDFLATTHCIVEDKKGFFWMTTNKGLFQASKRDLLNYAAGKQKDVFYFITDGKAVLIPMSLTGMSALCHTAYGWIYLFAITGWPGLVQA